jgi:RNA-binding protein
VTDETTPAPKPASEPLPPLTGKQRRHLRALGHALTAVVQVGKDGVSSGLVSQANEQLEVHELIKVKIAESAPGDRHAVAGDLATATKAALAQVLGRTFLLYRRRKKDPKIVLPKTKE